MSFLTIVVILISGIFMLVVSYGFKKNWEISMNYKILACLILPILNIAFGVALNLLDSIDSPATLKNFLVTTVHLTVWIICFGFAYKAESKGVLVFYAIFWALTSGIAALTAYIDSVETTVDFTWAIPIAMLLLPQWFGLNYLVEGYFVSSMIVLVMSLIIFSAAVWRWKNVK
ncbi:hypothetical protein K7887_02855 [Sutcliffiella horikoshii]|uniref:hypothetical protein n=1 Tax=Sutcliffiella horikoshii TaxID=79883 RepID=UPI001CC0ADE1|nr:hypothetical protein [Sutcliffiella horikoshii]UAL47925.1 hypothetical protein K7887_02855 [Sutcliffiella horikoshii]